MLNNNTWHFSEVRTACALYARGAELKLWPGDQLSWLKISVIVLSS